MAFRLAELNRHPTAIQSYFLPVVEKKFEGVERFFEELPRTDISMNRFHKVPVLTGMNSHEGAVFLQTDSKGNIIFESDFYYFIPYYLHIKRGDKRVGEIVKKLRKFYFNDQKVDESKKLEYVNMLSDKYFQYSLMLFPEILCKTSKDVYFYMFQYTGSINTKAMKNLGLKGATHGDIIQYQFYRQAKHDKCKENDLKIVGMLSEVWCTFARYGKPSWSDQKTEWLPYTKKDKHSLIIDEEIKLMKNPHFDRLKFWLGVTGESSKL